MKSLVLFFTFVLFYNIGLAEDHSHYLNLASDTVPNKLKKHIIKNEKIYCSDFGKTKYKILITGDKIKITRLYMEYIDTYSGILRRGKIYSQDPNEKGFKDVWGKYYKLDGKNFGVLNIENGDYELFTECKPVDSK